MSLERSRELPAFKVIASLEVQLAEDERAEQEPVELKWENFVSDSRPAAISMRNKPSIMYEVSSPEFNRRRIEMDSYLKEFTRLWIKNLKEDPYVEEGFRIACDYIRLKSEK